MKRTPIRAIAPRTARARAGAAGLCALALVVLPATNGTAEAQNPVSGPVVTGNDTNGNDFFMLHGRPLASLLKNGFMNTVTSYIAGDNRGPDGSANGLINIDGMYGDDPDATCVLNQQTTAINLDVDIFAAILLSGRPKPSCPSPSWDDQISDELDTLFPATGRK